MSEETRTPERCTECGQPFTLVARAWPPLEAEAVAIFLRRTCCVCDACLTRGAAAPSDVGEEEG